jgi:hypothetical protein
MTTPPEEVGLDHSAVVALEQHARQLAETISQKAVSLADENTKKAAGLAAEASLRAAQLASAAADKAITLANSDQEKAVLRAVAQALRDQHVDQVLEIHTTRLNDINGSQEKVFGLLSEHGLALSRIEAVAGKHLSNRSFRVSVASVVVMLASVLAALASGNVVHI